MNDFRNRFKITLNDRLQSKKIKIQKEPTSTGNGLSVCDDLRAME